MSEESQIEQAEASLERIQSFDAKSLIRREELGVNYVFDDAVEDAETLIGLFKRVPISVLEEFPEPQLNTIKTQADQIFGIFSQILEFDDTQNNAAQVRNSLLDSLANQYAPVFQTLSPLISFSLATTVDFGRLNSEARAVLQDIKDQTAGALSEIEETKSEAQEILDEVRKTAAEQGVSQQAVFFSKEAQEHETLATTWQWNTIYVAAALGAYGVVTVFAHKFPWIAPESLTESIQLIASKVLIFFVLAYMLVLSSRNFMSHKHNAVVNKHRQNALQTYKALVDASGTPEARDTVLSYAASSVFSPQDTGYTKQPNQPGNTGGSPMDVLPKAVVQLREHS